MLLRRLSLHLSIALALKNFILPTPVIEPNGTPEQMASETEALMDILVDSLYTDKDIFLRELVSNANDAIERHRARRVANDTDTSETNYEIRLIVDDTNDRLLISDNGIGMCEQELREQLGTIANSASRVAALQKKGGIIGQFGVGFYSVFLVADRVVVHSKCQEETQAHSWIALGRSQYVISNSTATFEDDRGTIVELVIQRELRTKYLNLDEVKSITKRFDQFLKYPVLIGRIQDDELEQVHESDQSFWLRDSSTITEKEYAKFYKTTWKRSEEPLAHVHFKAEGGDFAFSGLIYLPKRSGDSDVFKDLETPNDGKVLLYVQRVLVNEQKLFPSYLSFLHGVVESSDSTQLKVDRQGLKDSRTTRRIKRKLLNKAFEMFKSLSEEKYDEFWAGYGHNLALGCVQDEDATVKQKILELFRFPVIGHENKTKSISLSEYKSDWVRPGQKKVYYYGGTQTDGPLLEVFKQFNVTVLHTTGPFDESCLLQSFRGMELQSIEKGGLSYEDKARIELGGDDEGVEERAKAMEEEYEELAKEFEPLTTLMRRELGHFVEVKISSRLTDSAYLVTVPPHGFTSSYERVMRTQAGGSSAVLRDMIAKMKVLELNPDHPITRALLKKVRSGDPNNEVGAAAKLILQSGFLIAGFEATDPALVVSHVNRGLERVLTSHTKDEL